MSAPATAATSARFRHTRAELQATNPQSYRFWKHAAVIAGFTTAGVVLALSQLDHVRPLEWLFFAAMLVFTNFGEWAVHRTTLHHPIFPRAVYHRHVVQHHAFFTYESMALDSWRDARWVLFPPWALPLLVATVLPIYFLIRAVAPPNFSWLFLLAVVTYYGTYEVFHTLAHLPPTNPLAGSRFVRALTGHHRIHHDPRLMSRWNFNFAIPIFDWLFGTLYRESGAPPSQSPWGRGRPKGG